MKKLASLSSFFALAMGFLTRPCCSIPFFLNLAGASGSSLALALFPYRGLLRLASFAGLGVAFLLIYGFKQNHPVNRISFWLSALLVLGQWLAYG